MGLIASAAPKLLTDVAAIIGAVSAIALGSAVIVRFPPVRWFVARLVVEPFGEWFRSHVVTATDDLREALSNRAASVEERVEVVHELATSAPVDGETVRYAGSVTFQVTHPPFGVQVDHEGTVTAVHLAEVKGLRFDGQDLAAIKVGLETVKDLPVEDLPVEDLPVKGGRL